MSYEEDDRKKVPFAPEWFLAMVETGFFGLRDWLVLNNAPREAIELLDEIVLLAQYQGELTASSNLLSPDDIDNLLRVVSQMTENAARLGATFRSSVGNSQPREPLEWRAPDLNNSDAPTVFLHNGDAPLVLGINKNEN